MPLYTLKDIKTRDTWEVTCSWNELQETLDTMPDGWKEVLNKVKSGSGRDNTIKT